MRTEQKPLTRRVFAWTKPDLSVKIALALACFAGMTAWVVRHLPWEMREVIIYGGMGSRYDVAFLILFVGLVLAVEGLWLLRASPASLPELSYWRATLQGTGGYLLGFGVVIILWLYRIL